ncbi:MAG: S41 family peptidase [Planctomycetaceae bacterium]
MRSGDVIQEVEGKATEGVALDEIVRQLQGPVGRPVQLKVKRADRSEAEEMTLVRQLIKAPTVRGYQYNDRDEWDYFLPNEDHIAILRISHFSRFTAEEVRSTVDALVKQDLKGLVLDLRFNPGGLLESAIEIADMFLTEGEIVSVRGRNVAERSWTAREAETFPTVPMAVLVNHYSASASEVLSACLQDNHRAVIVGERTWGKGSVQNVIQMEGGQSALKLTTASYHRPSGENIHRFPNMKPSDAWGVTPDDGFLIPFSQGQWMAWDRSRTHRDTLKHEVRSAAPDENESVSTSAPPSADAKNETSAPADTAAGETGEPDNRGAAKPESSEAESTDSAGGGKSPESPDKAASEKTTAEGSTTDDDFEDTQLKAAVEYIRKKLATTITL